MTSSLISRLEEAKGPSRELDVLIYRRIAYATPSSHPSDYDHAPHYTSSVDAALTLVPEGFGTHIEIHRDDPKSFVWLHSNGPPVIQTHSPGSFQPDERKPPAIAICIAALKAREALRAQVEILGGK